METDKDKRRFLTFLTGGLAGAGVVAASIPFIKSMLPTREMEEKYIDVDITKLQHGQMLSVAFENKPIYILSRSETLLNALSSENPNLADLMSRTSKQPDKVKNYHRSVRPDIFVAYAMCTHLGCSVSYDPPGHKSAIFDENSNGGFYCPCHGAIYDLAGRVYKRQPAPYNLEVPNYEIINKNIVRIRRNE